MASGSSAVASCSAQIELLAEDDTGREWSWVQMLSVDEPLQTLISEWSKEHIPEGSLSAVVRCPDSDEILDATLSPEQLWGAQGSRRKRSLWIEPQDASAEKMEETPPAEQASARATVAMKRPLSTQANDATQPSQISSQPAKRAKVVADAQSEAGSGAESAQGISDRDPALGEDEGAASAIDAEGGAQNDVAKSAAAAGIVKATEREKVGEPAPTALDDHQAVSKPEPTKAPGPKPGPGRPPKVKEAPAAKAKSKDVVPGRASAADRNPGVGKPPSGEDSIEFEIPNPKNPSSGSGKRYEQYMRAKTVAEALVLGAAPGDIAHDFKKGFLRRR